jgi:hypothetical protein
LIGRGSVAGNTKACAFGTSHTRKEGMDMRKAIVAALFLAAAFGVWAAETAVVTVAPRSRPRAGFRRLTR